MKQVAESIAGYGYGSPAVAASPVPLEELEQLEITVGLTAEDEPYLRLAGEVVTGQTRAVVLHWRSPRWCRSIQLQLALWARAYPQGEW